MHLFHALTGVATATLPQEMHHLLLFTGLAETLGIVLAPVVRAIGDKDLFSGHDIPKDPKGDAIGSACGELETASAPG